MIFLWPFMLWLLLLLPVLVLLYVLVLRRKKRGAVRFANLAMVKAALGKSVGWRRHVPPALFLLALGVLIVATARPAAEITLNAARSTVILAMDISRFTDPDEFRAQVESQCDAVTACLPAEGFDCVMLPGQPEIATREVRERDGVPVPETTWRELLALAAERGVTITL